MAKQEPPQYLLERYRLEHEIGSGGFATVYAGYDERLDRDVAIKMLHPEHVRSISNLERFLREARTAARLQHHGIVQVYDLGEESDWHYIVMEFVQGKTLRDYMADNDGQLSISDALEIISAILQGLDYAHQNGVIHRDIKPENIMITDDGIIKIADFGLALRDSDLRITESHSFVGTIFYLAPEAIHGRDLDHRMDIYAVGALFYEILTNNPPFNGTSVSQVISSILRESVKFPPQISPPVPDVIQDIILKMLEKHPDDRYTSAQDVLSALPKGDDLQAQQSDQLRDSAEMKLSLSRLQRIVDASSAHYQQPDEDQLDTQGEGQQLLLFAAQGDTINALEIERRRIADMLDDSVKSQISLILSQINAYEMSIPRDPQVKMALSVLSTLIRDLSQQVHDIETNLRPAVLQTLGLEPALEEFINQQRRANGISIQLTVQRLRERLDNTLELILFRTTQDVVERAVKRANASHVVLQLQKVDNSLRYMIEDDGHPPDNATLLTSRQRIQSLGGTVTMDVSRYNGMALIIEFDMTPPIELTEREMDVIELLAEGLTNKEIGAILHIAARTVKFHLDNIFGKLGVNTRTEAAIYAVNHGWIRNKPLSE